MGMAGIVEIGDGAAGAQVERELRYGLRVRRFDDGHEVEASEDGVLGHDPAAERLDFAVHLEEALGVAVQGLLTLRCQFAHEDEDRHRGLPDRWPLRWAGTDSFCASDSMAA